MQVTLEPFEEIIGDQNIPFFMTLGATLLRLVLRYMQVTFSFPSARLFPNTDVRVSDKSAASSIRDETIWESYASLD